MASQDPRPTRRLADRMGPVPLSTDQTLLGLGLVVVLALACLLVSMRLRLPAIVLLLPVGFGAGAVTEVVHPAALLANAYQPLVSLGVGVPGTQDGPTPLFLLRGGRLIVVTAGLRAEPAEGDIKICITARSPRTRPGAPSRARRSSR